MKCTKTNTQTHFPIIDFDNSATSFAVPISDLVSRIISPKNKLNCSIPPQIFYLTITCNFLVIDCLAAKFSIPSMRPELKWPECMIHML